VDAVSVGGDVEDVDVAGHGGVERTAEALVLLGVHIERDDRVRHGVAIRRERQGFI
jgi:hypothetical protein